MGSRVVTMQKLNKKAMLVGPPHTIRANEMKSRTILTSVFDSTCFSFEADIRCPVRSVSFPFNETGHSVTVCSFYVQTRHQNPAVFVRDFSNSLVATCMNRYLGWGFQCHMNNAVFDILKKYKTAY